jgi:hypothetical protein
MDDFSYVDSSTFTWNPVDFWGFQKIALKEF